VDDHAESYGGLSFKGCLVAELISHDWNEKEAHEEARRSMEDRGDYPAPKDL
jgi:hypothetical protein